MKKLLLLVLTFTFSIGINGQTSKVERPEQIDKLMKAVGGEAPWINAKGFYMLEIANYSSQKLPLIRQFWVDFEQPRIKMKTRSAEIHEVRALNVNSGWTLSDDQLKDWEDKTLNGFRSFWPGIPTRIFHLLATDDPSLTYDLDDDKINFYVNGTFAVWIATDPHGKPVAYGRSNNHAETHFLGEILDYGPVKLWKEAFEPGGQWNVLMVDYELLTDMSDIEFTPPSH